MGGTQHTPQNAILLIMETTKEVHLILGTPLLCNSLTVPPPILRAFFGVCRRPLEELPAIVEDVLKNTDP